MKANRKVKANRKMDNEGHRTCCSSKDEAPPVRGSLTIETDQSVCSPNPIFW